MTFFTWMMRNHKGDATPARDLAADMHRDKEHFPRNGTGKFQGWHDQILSYLYRQQACPECIDIFEECWKEYELCERKRLNYSLRGL